MIDPNTLLPSGMVAVNERLRIGFERTLRLPDDGKTYPLPPGLGALPVRRVIDYADRLPTAWRAHTGPQDLFLPLHDREALFLVFVGADWKPCAVKVGVGGVNAVSGVPWDETLHGAPQDYLVCPPQPWLDGINTGDGSVRQFVAVPLGQGHTIEAQITGRETVGGIQIVVWDPQPGRFPDRPPEPEKEGPLELEAAGLEGVASEKPAAMGLGAGGQIGQRIYPDPYGLESWESLPVASLRVHLVQAQDWHALTGEELPPTPISAALYAAYGLPFFTLEDAGRGDVPALPALAQVKSIQQLQREETGRQDAPLHDATLPISDDQIISLRPLRQSDAPGEPDITPPKEDEKS